jgi:hypothetical protein
MKAKALLVAVFVAGIAASFAIAAPTDHGDKGKGKNKSTATTSTTPAQTCRNVELSGTVPASTFTMTVQKASRRARPITSATIAFSGPVKVNARMCTTATTGTTATTTTFQLRVLKVRNAKDDDDDD